MAVMTLERLNPGNIQSQAYRDTLGKCILDQALAVAASMTLSALLPEEVNPCDNKKSEVKLSAVAERVLGEDGLRRLEAFKVSCLGWDFGTGNPLSQQSVANLNAFVNALPELVACEPSLFMTRAGNLQMGWEDENGGKVEVEFFPDEVQYYIQSLGEEASVKMEDVEGLVSKLRAI